MNTELIEQNVQRLLGAMSGAATTAMVAVGDQLGLYRALADGGPARPASASASGSMRSTRPVTRPTTTRRTWPARWPRSATRHRRSSAPRLAQPGGVALGAQAGPAVVRQLAQDAGFSRFREVTRTPVNVVLELRP